MKKLENPKLYIFFSVILPSKASMKANIRKNIQLQYSIITTLLIKVKQHLGMYNSLHFLMY